MLRLMFLLAALLGSVTSHANYAERPEGKALIEELQQEGLDAERMRVLLASAQRKDSILEAIARPAEKTKTWAEYRRIFIQDSRIQQGIAFRADMQPVLARAYAEYGVPEHMILAILGVETRYGKHKGSFRVVDALATLAFDYPPRSAFFRKQLAELFRLEQVAHIDAGEITGSYAGAMGYPQFIPSSYIHYAVDFDGDGITDLVNNPVDAIGSVANYFAEHGWKKGFPVAARARVKGSAWQGLVQDKPKPEQTIGSLRKAGATSVPCSESQHCFKDLPDDTPVALLELEGENGKEYWMTTENFYVITRYNHSNLYAMAAYQLGELLREAAQ